MKCNSTSAFRAERSAPAQQLEASDREVDGCWTAASFELDPYSNNRASVIPIGPLLLGKEVVSSIIDHHVMLILVTSSLRTLRQS